eukprot:4136776-Amphidinium_carterae.1
MLKRQVLGRVQKRLSIESAMDCKTAPPSSAKVFESAVMEENGSHRSDACQNAQTGPVAAVHWQPTGEVELFDEEAPPQALLAADVISRNINAPLENRLPVASQRAHSACSVHTRRVAPLRVSDFPTCALPEPL